MGTIKKPGTLNLSEDDKALVEAISQGDKAAFKKVYDKYHANLYRHALKFLRSSDMAQETVQVVYIKVWENRQKLNSNLSFKNYIATICRNEIMTLLTKAARENNFKEKFLQHSMISKQHLEEPVEYNNEMEEFVRDAISNLPPQRQVVFRLCKIEGKTYEEVAHHLHISRGTVRDHMLKAKISIRQYLVLHANINLIHE